MTPYAVEYLPNETYRDPFEKEIPNEWGIWKLLHQQNTIRGNHYVYWPRGWQDGMETPGGLCQRISINSRAEYDSDAEGMRVVALGGDIHISSRDEELIFTLYYEPFSTWEECLIF